MVVNPTVEIDLAEYGDQSGAKLIMSEPSFRRINEMKNAVRRCIAGAKIDKNNPPKPEDVAFGDMEIIATMAYVKIAPFKADVDGFLAYTDLLDDVKVGNGNALFERMKTEAEKLKAGEQSPLPN